MAGPTTSKPPVNNVFSQFGADVRVHSLADGVVARKYPLHDRLPDAQSALAEALCQDRRKLMALVLEGKNDGPLLASYRSKLSALSAFRPGKALWDVEMEFLPADLALTTFSHPRLPATKLPLSFSGWKNEALEAFLSQQVPEYMEKERVTKTLASLIKVLDRLTAMPFPPELVSDFYRPAVLRLKECYGKEGYESSVFRQAVSLLAKTFRPGAQPGTRSAL